VTHAPLGTVQCGAWQGGAAQLSSAQLSSTWLGSAPLSSAPLGSAQHGSRQQQDSSMAPLGSGSARHCQLCSAQLSSHTVDHGWPTILLDRERGCGHCATSHARAVHLERATAALRRAGRPHSPPVVTLVVGSAQLAHTVLAVHPASDGYLVSEKPTVEADGARSSPTWAGGRGVGAHGQQRPSRRRQWQRGRPITRRHLAAGRGNIAKYGRIYVICCQDDMSTYRNSCKYDHYHQYH